MTNNEKVEYLKKYRILQLQYCIRDSYYKQLRDKLKYPAPTIQLLSDMPSAHNVSNPVESNYIQLETLEAEMQNRQCELLEVFERTEKAILRLDNKTYSNILLMWYIQGLKREEIAVELSYSWRYLHKLHWRAIREIKL